MNKYLQKTMLFQLGKLCCTKKWRHKYEENHLNEKKERKNMDKINKKAYKLIEKLKEKNKETKKKC